MGQSTDGILVFGIPLPEEETPEFLEEFDGDWEDFVDSISGLPEWGEPDHDWDKIHAFRKSYPINLTRHCSIDYTMYILSINGTETTAGRGYPQVINPEQMKVDSAEKEVLLEFCEEYGIEWQEPKWYLCSYWG